MYTTIPLTLDHLIRLRDAVQSTLNTVEYGKDESQLLSLSLHDELSNVLLTSLILAHGCGLIRPASAPDIPSSFTEAPMSVNGTAPVLQAALFLPCFTPVGPSKCLHLGSHHAAKGGGCTHPGCDCRAFSPGADIAKASVSRETVMDYLRRMVLFQKSPWDGDEMFAALQRAWIPGAAPASDWQGVLGRVFPDMVDVIVEMAPL